MIEETDCTNVDAAEAFLDEFADVLSEIAHIHPLWIWREAFLFPLSIDRCTATYV